MELEIALEHRGSICKNTFGKSRSRHCPDAQRSGIHSLVGPFRYLSRVGILPGAGRSHAAPSVNPGYSADRQNQRCGATTGFCPLSALPNRILDSLIPFQSSNASFSANVNP